MGFWDWIFGKQTADHEVPTARRSPARSSHRQTGGTAVAVADDPDEASIPETPTKRKWWNPEEPTVTVLTPIERPDLSVEARALENLLVSHFDGHNLTLPPLLQVAERVRPKLADRDVDLGKIAAELGEDQVIAAAVLRMANSPLYRGLNKITALRPAVARLGTRALRTLLMHESLRAAMFYGKGASRELAVYIWRQSLAGAYVMRSLSRFTRTDPENAFLVGLLHDIGNVIVLRIASEEQPRMHYEIDFDTFNYLCYECHQEFGELVADAWSLPDDLKAIITDHHTDPDLDNPLRRMRLQLMFSDMICSLLGYQPYRPYRLLHTEVFKDLKIPIDDKFATFLDELPDRVDDMVAAL
ncbi:MAG: HDOD domain-containing protein [Phycisphaerae bacterium]|jgi:HD-like signal output (HDOD) protein